MEKGTELVLSKKYFISLTLIMLLLVVLFQVSASGSSYFIQEKNNIGMEKGRMTTEGKDFENGNPGNRGNPENGVVVIVGDKERYGFAAREALQLIQKCYVLTDKLEDVLELENVESVLMCNSELNYPEDLELLAYVMKKGIPVIFAVLPQQEFLANSKVQEFLGIAQIRADEAEMDGLRVLDSFLIGGRSDYKEFPMEETFGTLRIPDIQVSGISKVYMCGLYEKQEERGIKNEELPALAWRTYQYGTPVFVFTVPFLQHKEYAGMYLSALACTKEDFLYPVINARTVVVDQFPFLSSENDEQMQKIYSNSSKRLLEDTILPNLVAVTKKTGDQISGLATVGIRGGEAEVTDTMGLFIDDMAAKNSTIGLGGGGDGKQVLENFAQFNSMYPDYRFLFVDGRQTETADCLKLQKQMPELGTVLADWSEEDTTDIRFLGEDMVQTVVTSSGFAYSDVENLKLRCAMGGFGISNHLIDLAETIYPSFDEEKAQLDNWKDQNIDLGKNLDTYWQPYQSFDSMTIPEEGDRIRQYLLLDYEISRTVNQIILRTDNCEGPVYFILKSFHELLSVEGGSYVRLDRLNYLLTIEEREALLTLRSK